MNASEQLADAAAKRGLHSFAKAIAKAALPDAPAATSDAADSTSLAELAERTGRQGFSAPNVERLLGAFPSESLEQRLCAATALQKALHDSQKNVARLRELTAPVRALVANGAVDGTKTPLATLLTQFPSGLATASIERLEELGGLCLRGRWYALGSVVTSALVDQHEVSHSLGDLVELLLDGNAAEQLPAERFKLGEEETPERVDLAEYFMLRMALLRPEMREGVIAVRDLIESARAGAAPGPLTTVADALFSVGDPAEAQASSMAMDRAVRKTRRAWRFGSLARCVVTAVGLPESESILNLARSHVEQHGNDGLFWLGMLSASTAATWRNDLLGLLVSELRAQPHEVALWQGLAVSGLLPDEPRTLLAELNVQLGRQWNGS